MLQWSNEYCYQREGVLRFGLKGVRVPFSLKIPTHFLRWFWQKKVRSIRNFSQNIGPFFTICHVNTQSLEIITQVVCRHRMRIFNTSFVYLFWWANNQKGKYPEFCLTDFLSTWYVVGSIAHVVCCHQMHILNPLFVYLILLGNNKKAQYLEFCKSCSDETLYVGATG